MSPRAKIHSFGVLLVAAALAIFLWSRLALHRAEAVLADVTARRTELIKEARQGASPKSPERLKAVPASVPDRTKSVPGGRANPVGVLMGDAKLQMAYFTARRASLPSTYGPLFRALNLSPDQTKLLEDRIMDRDQQFFDIVSTVPDAIRSISYAGNSPFIRNPFLLTSNSEDGQGLQPGTPDSQAAAELLRQNDASFQESATALLGPAGYQQLLQYERMLPVRDVVDNLGSNAAVAGAPLNAGQADQLTQILANASSTYQQGAAAARGENGVDWSQAMTQAAQVLSPDQLVTLQAQVAPIQSMRQLRTAVSAAGGLGDTAK
jgi:hypothetical protein